jgi:adenosylcobinamide-GDP ribazoletransferase
MRPFFTALAFLTLLPSPRYDDFEGDELGRAMAVFPLVGLILGGLLYVINILLSPNLPEGLTNIILIATLVLLTGGIHLDGLMDTADGFGGGNNRSKVLEIMRDSRTGSFGVLAVILLLMVKWEALNSLSGESKGTVLLIMPLAARWGQVMLTYISPSARVDGFGRHVIKGLGVPALSGAFFFTLGISILLAGWPGLAVVALVSLFSFLWSRLFVIRIGGITGDVIGALSELLEVLVLLGFVIII